VGRCIFSVAGDGDLKALTEKEYSHEGELQRLLERHPELLAGDQIDPVTPRRWLLVTRECHIPTAEGAGGWVDLLFVDQDGVPTLVEVKRSSDTRLRREVVGQMLEYAAHAALYWQADRLRATFEAFCKEKGMDPEEMLHHLLSEVDPDLDSDGFWEKVDANLRSGRLRLLFVADAIPPELRRTIEFLNEQMSPAEVLAVEVRQFAGDDLTTLVPTVLGLTGKGEAKHARGRGQRKWNEASFMRDIEEKHGPDALRTARRLLDWLKPQVSHIYWGTGMTEGSFVPVIVDDDGMRHPLLRCGTGRPSVQIYFQVFKEHGLLDEGERDQLRQDLNQIEEIHIPSTAIDRYPSIPLLALADDNAFELFKAAYRRVIEVIHRSARS